MCWMALIPVALAVVGGMSQGNAQDAQAQSQARTMRTNAMYANNAAQDAVKRGTYDADLQRIRTGQLIGTQRAAMASNGGLVDQGTNSILQQDTAQLGELDALTIQNNAAREAYGLKVQAMQGFRNATDTELAGKNAKQNSLLGGVIKGAGSFFGGGGASMFGGGGGASSGFGASSGSFLTSAYA